MARDRTVGGSIRRRLADRVKAAASRPACAVVAGCVALSACATTPRNPVLDKYPVGVSGRTTVDYYDVHGSTIAELRADMRRLGPKIDGSSFVGETRSPMQWNWRTESIAPGNCTITDVRVSMNAQVLLPKWTPPDGADSALVAEWKRFITALEVHEAGHKDISAKAGREIVERLRGMSGFCSQINTRANDLARQVTDRARDEQQRYDAETRHGITQGTAFGGGRFTIVAGSTLDPSAIANDSVRRALLDSRAVADRAAARVTRMFVTPASLDLRVGDSVASPELFRRLEVRGVTSEGDTVRNFARTYRIEPSALVDRVGRMIVARRAGTFQVWIVPGAALAPDARDTARAVRVPVHIKEATP